MIAYHICFSIYSPIFDLSKNKRNDGIFSDFAKNGVSKLKDVISSLFSSEGRSQLWSGSGAKFDPVSVLDVSGAEKLINEYNSLIDVTKKSIFAQEKFNQTVDQNVFKDYIKSVGDGIPTAEGYAKATEQAAAAQNKFGHALSSTGIKGVLTSFAKTVGSMVLNMAAAAAAMAIFNGIVHIIDEIHESEEEIIERGKEAQKTITETRESYSTKKSTLDDFDVDSYSDMKGQVNTKTNANETLSADKYQEYLKISNELAELFPQLVQGYDAQGNAILNLSSDADTATQSLADLLEQERQLANYKISENLQDAYDGIKVQSDQLDKEIEKLKAKNEYIEGTKDLLTDDIGNEFIKQGSDTLQFYLSEEKEGQDKYVKKLEAYRTALQNTDLDWNSYLQESSFTTLDGNYIANATDTLIDLTEDQREDFIAEYKNQCQLLGIEASATFAETMGEIQLSEAQKKTTWAGLVPSMQSYVSTLGDFLDISEDKDIQETIINGINSLIGGFDVNKLDASDFEAMGNDIYGWIADEFFSGILSVPEESKEAAAKALANLFTLDSSDLTTKEAAKKVESYLDAIYPNEDDLEQREELKLKLGITMEVDTNDDGITDKVVNAFDYKKQVIAEKLGSPDGYMDDWSVGKIDQAYDMVINGYSGAIQRLSYELDHLDEVSKENTFAEIFANTEDGSISASIDEYQDAIGKLQAAQENLRNGKLTGGTLTDLFQEFPELIAQADNLGSALNELSAEKATKAITSIRNAMKDMKDPAELAGGESLIRSILDTLDFSDADIAEVNERIWSAFAPTTDSPLDERFAVDKINDFYAEFDAELGTEKGREILLTLLADSANAELTIQEFRTKYEDEEIIYDIKANDEAIAHLEDDLSRIQDEAKAIQDGMSLKEAKGGVLSESDYVGAISKANEEIAKYNELIQEQEDKKDIILGAGGSKDSEDYLAAEAAIRSYNSAIDNLTLSQIEWNEAIANIPLNKLGNKLTDLQAEATNLESALSLKEAKGVKPLITDYQSLINNSKEQISNLQLQNKYLQIQQSKLNPLSSKYQEIQSQINSNVSAIDSARLAQLEWNEAIDGLNYEPNEGLMAYNKAKETRNAGDNYLDMLTAAKEAQEAWNNGLVGTDDFKTAASMFSPNGMDDAANWKENYDNIQRYFTEDVSGVKNFLKDLESEQLAAQDAMGNWSYEIDDVQESADALGISFEAFLAVMGRLQDYGFSNDFFSSVEEGQDHISDLYIDLYEAENKLNELKQAQTDGDETVTDTVLSAQESRINQIKQSILESQNLLDQLIAKDADQYEKEYTGKMNSLVQRLRQAGDIDDEGARKSYISKIKDWAESEAIDISGLFTFDENINQDMLDYLSEKYQVDLTLSTEQADKAAKELGDTITSAMEDSESEVKPLVDSLAQYTNEQFSNITFGDGSYAEGALGEAERTIDRLLTSLGLTQEQAQFLLQVLGELGYIEFNPEVNTEGVTTGVQDATSTAQAEADSNPIEIPTHILANEETINYAEQQTAKIKVDGDTSEAKADMDEAKAYGDSQDATIDVGANISPATDTVATLIRSVNSRTASIKVDANTSALSSSINNALSGTRTINLRAQILGGLPGAIGPANGTAHAHVSGTAYSMWTSYRHSIGAYANGTRQSWGLKSDETALVNELGMESRVRNGQWELIPGGAHFESFKKGDIIFNHKQTAELLKYGHVVSDGGRGRIAHADGTAYNMTPAFSNGINNYGTFQGGLASTPSSSTTSNLQTAVKNLGNTSDKSTKKVNKLEKALEELDKLFDWIEVRLDRIQRDIDYDTALSENAVGYKAKNDYLTSAQADTKTLISANKKGAEKYKAQADKTAKKVGLSDSLYNKIKDGSISIQSLSEDDKKRVEAVKQWYDKMLDCQQAIEELKASQRELAQTKLDNITDQYDAMLAHLEHSADMINGFMDQAELKGLAESTKYYEALIGNAGSSIKEMQAERTALLQSLQQSVDDGIIKVNSVEWYEMQSQINDVTLAIQDANTNILEYQDNIRQINWDRFDKQREAVGRLVDEADFLIDLMSTDDLFDDKGRMTDQGMATVGLHGQNYNVLMEQANEYRDEMKRINEDLQKAENKGNTKLIERREELLDLQRDSILAAEDEKQAIKDLVQEGIEKELDALQDLIDKYVEALDSQKDLNDYQKDVSDKAKEVASIQKQLKAYENDDSEEGRAKRQELQTSLKEAQEELEQTEYDKYISDQKELLDTLYTEYEDVLNQRLDNIDQLMADMIETVNTNASSIAETLSAESKAVGYELTSEMESIWGSNGSATGILSTYSEKFSGTMTTVQATIDGILGKLTELVTIFDEQAGKDVTTSTTVNADNPKVEGKTPTIGSSSGGDSNNGSGNESEGEAKDDEIVKIIKSGKSGKDYIAKQRKAKNHSKLWTYIVDKYGHVPTYAIYEKLGKKLGVKAPKKYKVASETNALLKKLKAKGYASGTSNVPKEDNYWTNENGQEYIIRKSDGAVLQRLFPGDKVLNAQASENMYNFAVNPSQFMNDLNIGSLSSIPVRSSAGNVKNNNTITFNLPQVKNYEEFVSAMQHDKKFEEMVQNMTIGRINGKSSLNKYKVKF